MQIHIYQCERFGFSIGETHIFKLYRSSEEMVAIEPLMHFSFAQYDIGNTFQINIQELIAKICLQQGEQPGFKLLFVGEEGNNHSYTERSTDRATCSKINDKNTGCAQNQRVRCTEDNV